MTPEQLKASILQCAIQGKLVEQRPEEGMGEELYQQMQIEKKRLIKEGKIKKRKPLAEIAEDEIPFDLPESWKWVKLGDCTGYAQTKEKISPKDITGDMWTLDLEDIQRDTGAILVKTKASERQISGDKVKFHKGQVLYSKLRPYLKKILVAPDDGICTSELVPFDTYLIDENYIAYVLRSPHIDYVINSATYGVKMPRVGTDTMTNLLIPLPPLAEQKRIVAKIEELLPYVDCYAAAYEKLERFNAKFPEDMKKSILQYAIQGKLVEQRAEEGAGEELYQQIQAEKKRLIKEGKIKKEKPLAEITEDEIPFDIPKSWKWVRLNDAVLSVADIDHKMPETVEGNGYPYISPVNFTPTGIDYDNAKIVGKSDFEHLSKKCKPEKGDIVFPRYGTIGVVRMVDTDRDFLVSYSCCTVKNIDKLMNPQYVFYVLQSEMIKQEINRYINKTTQPNVGLQSIKQFLFPMPPLSEQKRIVAKLEELLPLCERLK